MFQIQPITIELLYTARGNHDPRRIFEFQDVESENKGLAEGGNHSVVWWCSKGQEVGFRGRGGAGYGASGLAAGGDGEGEECGGHFGGLFVC